MFSSNRSVARIVAALLAVCGIAALFVPLPANAQGVRLKDITHVQGVTSNQLVGYGIVTGLGGTGDTTSVLFTSKTIVNVLQTFGLTAVSNDVRTRNVAAVIVTANLGAFAHSGDNVDVTVSSMGDATTLQGGTLVMTELRGPNGLVYATAQGPVSVGGFSIAQSSTNNAVSVNFTTAGRVPLGGVIARDMVTNIQQDSQGFSYILTSPDYKTAARVAYALNAVFGGVARAIDAATIRVNLPPKYANDPVNFLADASDIAIDADQRAKVIVNERTGTIVLGGDITLAPVAIAHGNLAITVTTANRVVPGAPFGNNPSVIESNTRISASESGKKLVYINGAANLGSVVRALNTIGVSPRDLIAIVQALRESGSLQADVEII